MLAYLLRPQVCLDAAACGWMHGGIASAFFFPARRVMPGLTKQYIPNPTETWYRAGCELYVELLVSGAALPAWNFQFCFRALCSISSSHSSSGTAWTDRHGRRTYIQGNVRHTVCMTRAVNYVEALLPAATSPPPPPSEPLPDLPSRAPWTAQIERHWSAAKLLGLHSVLWSLRDTRMCVSFRERRPKAS
ncbi:hypothetical protein L227DRAFT_392201 [Lentinus tigrinus ALCF2SS1-6]|uniref:Uncharacterized protein n=1 Tax=Lentinus tigrinus ALCF2SS1-6 TaxID=1328759 RepID=A0A5C2SID5_9APHY|nr:hypothetical protein L227DRAFT_392201 [Lentinus tigrinus ALCF2SS1-6]